MLNFIRRSASILIIVIFVLVFVNISLFVCFIFVKNFSSPNKNSHEEPEDISTYKYFRINLLTKSTSSGLVSHRTFEAGQDFHSYEEENGVAHTLISSFGTGEYVCSGVCFCKNDENRRLVSQSLRGVVHLVAAVSSVVAIKLASDYFDTECKESFDDDECATDSIRSEVDECLLTTSAKILKFPKVKKGIKAVERGERDEREEYERKRNELTNDPSKKRFICSGICVDRVDSKKTKSILKAFKKERKKSIRGKQKVDCSDFTYTAIMFLDVPPLDEKDARFSEFSQVGLEVDYADLARVNFMYSHLHSYCVKQTNYGKPDNLEKFGLGGVVNHWCGGVENIDLYPHPVNDDVHCVRIKQDADLDHVMEYFDEFTARIHHDKDFRMKLTGRLMEEDMDDLLEER